jgi:hypothetical protein
MGRLYGAEREFLSEQTGAGATRGVNPDELGGNVLANFYHQVIEPMTPSIR